jgi:hypothetical protein
MWIESYHISETESVLLLKVSHRNGPGLNRVFRRVRSLDHCNSLLYIDDISTDSSPFIYADDTPIFEIVDYIDISAENLNEDLRTITDWSSESASSLQLGIELSGKTMQARGLKGLWKSQLLSGLFQ